MRKIGGLTRQDIEKFFTSQLREWDLAGNNYLNLDKATRRTLVLEHGCRIDLQFNPSRMRSSAAKVDKKSVSERTCFLCESNLPDMQRWLVFDGKYNIMVNPYPIFPRHLTVSLREHENQRIRGRFADMLKLAGELVDFTVFYNGPRCGASAPDHFHFQAGSRGIMPIENEFRSLPGSLISEQSGCRTFTIDNYHRHVIVIEGKNVSALEEIFVNIYDILQRLQENEEDEPMVNILAGRESEYWRVFIFPRRAHRPVQYFMEGSQGVLVSPASVDFGGLWITVRQEDFQNLDPVVVSDMFDQVSLGKQEWNRLISELAETGH
jgi:ATP adenylyltransferase/5',5'''-P-1,P-4-tetraphosphate phosphorylase II